MQIVREKYNVPAKRGMDIVYYGQSGHILSADRNDTHLYIKVQNGERLKVHPLDVEYRADGQVNCSQCGKPDAGQFYNPDESEVWLCEDCASGLFCLGCGAFTGGTEDIFLYGRYGCSNCSHLQEEDEDDYYDYADEPY